MSDIPAMKLSSSTNNNSRDGRPRISFSPILFGQELEGHGESDSHRKLANIRAVVTL
jgi:hypothetical protein